MPVLLAASRVLAVLAALLYFHASAHALPTSLQYSADIYEYWTSPDTGVFVGHLDVTMRVDLSAPPDLYSTWDAAGVRGTARFNLIDGIANYANRSYHLTSGWVEFSNDANPPWIQVQYPDYAVFVGWFWIDHEGAGEPGFKTTANFLGPSSFLGSPLPEDLGVLDRATLTYAMFGENQWPGPYFQARNFSVVQADAPEPPTVVVMLIPLVFLAARARRRRA